MVLVRCCYGLGIVCFGKFVGIGLVLRCYCFCIMVLVSFSYYVGMVVVWVCYGVTIVLVRFW